MVSYGPPYWRRAVERAGRATLRFFGFSQRSRLVYFVTAISYVVALLLVRWLGGTQQMNEELRWIVAILVAALVVFVPVFLVNLVVAPAQMEQDAIAGFEEERQALQSEKQYLEGRLRVKLSNEAIEQELGNLIDEGKEMVHGIVSGPEPPEEWQGRVADWRSRTTAFLKENVSFSKAASWDAGYYRARAEFLHEGATFTGDRALLASQVDLMLRHLESTQLMPQYYATGSSEHTPQGGLTAEDDQE